MKDDADMSSVTQGSRKGQRGALCLACQQKRLDRVAGNKDAFIEMSGLFQHQVYTCIYASRSGQVVRVCANGANRQIGCLLASGYIQCSWVGAVHTTKHLHRQPSRITS